VPNPYRDMLILEGGLTVLALIAMLVIGLVLLAVLVKVLLFLVIPGIMALVVWLITKDPFMTGVAFLAVALLTIIFKR